MCSPIIYIYNVGDSDFGFAEIYRPYDFFYKIAHKKGSPEGEPKFVFINL